MYLLEKRADLLNENDISRIVENKMQENRSLDYKKELKLGQDKDRKEFLFDIASMANTEGGCFIYGVEEKKDENGKNTGTPEAITGISIPNIDALKQQIEDLIRGNTEPKIPFVAINRITVGDKTVLVIGVAKSLGLPVMVTFNETNKFYKRRNTGKYTVDVYELNQMFMQNLVWKQAAENFRLQRIEKVRSLKVFPTLSVTTSFFIHILPLSFQNDDLLDLTQVERMELTKYMKPLNLSSWDTMFNLDGYATWNGMRNPQITSYDQLFRNGIYESYTSTMLAEMSFNNGTKLMAIDGVSFIPDVIKKIIGGVNVLKKFQIDAPFVVMISIYGVKDAVIYSKTHFNWSRPFLGNEIYLPPAILPESEKDIYKTLKPYFDIIWQSVSENQSPEISYL